MHSEKTPIGMSTLSLPAESLKEYRCEYHDKDGMDILSHFEMISEIEE